MSVTPLASAERARLEELKSYDILDTPPEEAFDRVTRLAARLLGAPIALVTIIDDKRQWFKSRYGLDISEMPREWGFCTETIRTREGMVVSDAAKDARFRFNPLVLGEPHIRFYAGVPLRTPHGQPLGVLCVLDSAPRPGLTGAQRETLKDLAAVIVDELELRLTTKRVLTGARERQALIERARAGGQAESDFLADISHELRNPLNAVLGYADLLLAAPYGPLGDLRYYTYLEAIQISGRHMLALVTGILDYAKLESGTPRLLFQTVDLSEVARETGRILGQAAADKGLRLETPADSADGAPALIRADLVKLRQMLINLVSNAIKFTLPGGVVSVSVSMLPDMARILVKDTGIGIAPEDMAKALAPFGQIRRNGAAQDGFGLGLPITNALVERHGGTLEIASVPGRGTEVRILLPIGF